MAHSLLYDAMGKLLSPVGGLSTMPFSDESEPTEE